MSPREFLSFSRKQGISSFVRTNCLRRATNEEKLVGLFEQMDLHTQRSRKKEDTLMLMMMGCFLSDDNRHLRIYY